MSGTVKLRAVLIAALRADAALMALVNSVEDGAAPKTSAPALLLGEMAATEWGARGIEGLAVRVPITLIDRSDRTDRLEDAAERVRAVIAALPAMAEDWRIGAVLLDRSRSTRGSDGRWALLLEYRARLSREM